MSIWNQIAMRAAPLALVPGSLLAQGNLSASTPRSDAQIWNELDVLTSVTQRTELSFALLERWESDGGRAVASGVGIDVNLKLSDHLTLTPSYYYAQSRVPTGEWRHAHLPVLAATLEASAGPCVFSDRSRIVGVFAEDGDSWVYQNRPRVECRLPSAFSEASVYLWDEVSYYSEFDDWKRNRLAAGLRIPFHPRYALDVYYLRQHDFGTRPARTDVVGITFSMRLGDLRGRE